MSYSGISPKNPSNYTGQKNGIVPAVSRNRRPTTADYKQPETGRNYPITCIWQVSKNPTTGSEGELWALSKIVANVATWTNITAGGTSGIVTVTGDNAVAVSGDGAGNLNLNGTTVLTGVNNTPIYILGTDSPSYKQEVQVQIANVVTATPANANDAGVASFNTAQFTIDGTSGMVGLKGGITPPMLMISLDDMNNATPDGFGVITLGGTAVTNGSNATPLFSVRTPNSNDIDFQLQIAKEVDPTIGVIANAGIASFNTNQFDVDTGTGMVSMKGSTTDNAVLAITADGPTSGGPDASGVLNFTGAGGATTSITGNVVTITAGSTGGGLTWREEIGTSANFSTNEGIFGNNAGTITLTLPSGPSISDTFAAYQEGAGKVRIQTQGADIIKFGNQSCAAGGYIESLNEGDCVWIVAIDATRFRVINAVGSWTISV